MDFVVGVADDERQAADEVLAAVVVVQLAGAEEEVDRARRPRRASGRPR